jgi:hypothetical protein
METSYLVTAESVDAIQAIQKRWPEQYEIDGCSFEGFDVQVFGVMEAVMKVVSAMEKDGKKENFSIVGKCETDYDCVLFSIEYTGDEPMIKASQGDPDEDEDKFYCYSAASYAEISKLLKRYKKRTFQKAIKDELPLGGFLDGSYEEWRESVLGE